MSKTRTNITISPRIKEVARKLMAGQGFDDFSGFVEHLIRQEHGKVFGTSIIADSDTQSQEPPLSTRKARKGRSGDLPDGR